MNVFDDFGKALDEVATRTYSARRRGAFCAMIDIAEWNEHIIRRQVGFFERQAAKEEAVTGKDRARFQRGYHAYLNDKLCPCRTCTKRREVKP